MAICRQYPSTYVVPLILSAVLLATGVYGVLAGAGQYESNLRGEVARYGQGVADLMVIQNTELLTPVATLAAFIRLSPSKVRSFSA